MTVCVHELAHLNEPTAVAVLRMFSGLQFLVVVVAVRPVIGDFGYSGVTGMLLAALVIRKITRRVARRMELRADVAGRAHQVEEGTYAHALERLYEANLTPVVMLGKRRPHPHLYDRLVAAGLTPSYPRPDPPSRSAIWLAVFVTLTIAITIYGMAFILLNKWLGSS
jgi:hypothetical protein